MVDILFHSGGIVVLCAGFGRQNQPVAVDFDALAQGAAFGDRLVDDREYEGRAFARSQRVGGAFPGGRQRSQCRPCARFGAEGQYSARLQDGYGDRPGGPRRVRGGADVGQPEGHQHPPVAAVAKDGIQLIAKARVTVRANIKQLVGGAGEETVLARVGEGIVSSIGSAVSHKVVLENPDSISRVVLDKGTGCRYGVRNPSIDIADIDVGKNIGAQLQMDQAQADKNIAQAKAEERRAMAVALEQGKPRQGAGRPCQGDSGRGRGAAGDGRGVPQWQSGDHGLLQDEKNVMADTAMREAISKPVDKKIGDPFAAGLATCRLRNYIRARNVYPGIAPQLCGRGDGARAVRCRAAALRYAARTGRFGR